jgi:hypothetical protein
MVDCRAATTPTANAGDNDVDLNCLIANYPLTDALTQLNGGTAPADAPASLALLLGDW